MEHHSLEIVPLLWLGGWLVAIMAVFWAALRLPLDIGYGSWRGRLYMAGIVLASVGVCALANVALQLHDGHVDLTREKIYTPSAAALSLWAQNAGLWTRAIRLRWRHLSRLQDGGPVVLLSAVESRRAAEAPKKGWKPAVIGA